MWIMLTKLLKLLQLLLLQQLLLLPLSCRLLLLLLLSLLLLPLLLLHIIYQPTALSHFLLQLPTPSVSLRTPVGDASPRPFLRRQSVDHPATSRESVGIVEIREHVVGLFHRR